MSNRPDNTESRSNNAGGSNQHRDKPLLEEHPDLSGLIQRYLNEGVLQKNLPETLFREHQVQVSLRSVQRIIKNEKISTTRKNTLTDVDKGAAILTLVATEDPLGRFGARKVKERLALQGTHIPRDFITRFQQSADPAASTSRHPVTRKVHHRGLWSSGPNEEWCVDGHEKILPSMGISVWGIIDKFSRMELGLWAVPDARRPEVPPALYLRVVRERGGIPLTTTSDMGGEVGRLAALQTSLRVTYMPDLDINVLPPHTSVKSVYNITRERGWRPIWENELANVHHKYTTGKVDAGFYPGNPVHEGISLWIWSKVVQNRLDNILQTNRTHRVRRQKNRLLPTGGRPKDFYETPWKYGGEDCLILVPSETVDRLIQDHTPAGLFQFVADETETLAKTLFEAVGSPELSAHNGWAVFHAMILKL